MPNSSTNPTRDWPQSFTTFSMLSAERLDSLWRVGHFDAPPPVPSYMLIGEIAPGWVVLQTLLIAVERETDGSYVLSDDLFLVYGAGRTLAEAQRDYIASLIEYYELMMAHEHDRNETTRNLVTRLKK